MRKVVSVAARAKAALVEISSEWCDAQMRSQAVAVSGSLIVDDLELVISRSARGVGFAYLVQQEVASEPADGSLCRICARPSPATIGADGNKPPLFRLVSILRFPHVIR